MPNEVTDQTVEPATPDVGATVDTGGTVEGAVQAPEAPTFDWSQYGDHLVTVKVDGTEQQVPLTEAISGYSRQADYTRKTQELAAEREQLETARAIAMALETDPARALKVLTDIYGADAAAAATQEPDEPLDPVTAEVRELRSWVSQQQQMQVEAQLAAQLQSYQEQHGVDPEALVNFALEHRIPNLEYALWGFLQTVGAARQQVEQQTAAADQARTDAKHLAGVVDGGTGRAPGAATVPTTGHKSVASAFKAAAQQLGFQG